MPLAPINIKEVAGTVSEVLANRNIMGFIPGDELLGVGIVKRQAIELLAGSIHLRREMPRLVYLVEITLDPGGEIPGREHELGIREGLIELPTVLQPGPALESAIAPCGGEVAEPCVT
jgi:hypothetical protein